MAAEDIRLDVFINGYSKTFQVSSYDAARAASVLERQLELVQKELVKQTTALAAATRETDQNKRGLAGTNVMVKQNKEAREKLTAAIMAEKQAIADENDKLIRNALAMRVANIETKDLKDETLKLALAAQTAADKLDNEQKAAYAAALGLNIKGKAAKGTAKDQFGLAAAATAAAHALDEETEEALKAAAALGIKSLATRRDEIAEARRNREAGRGIDLMRRGRGVLLSNLRSQPLFAAAVAGVTVALGPLSAGLADVAAGLIAVGGGIEPLIGLAAPAGAAFMALGQGITVLGIGLNNVFQTVKSQGTTFENNMEKLSKPAQEFVKFLRGDEIGDAFRRIQLQVQEGLFPGLTKGLREAMPLLKPLSQVFWDTARALGHLAEIAGRIMGSKSFGRDFLIIGERNRQTMFDLGNATMHFVGALRHMFVAAGPFIGKVTKGIRELAKEFEVFAMRERRSGDLREWFDEVALRTKQWLSILKDTFLFWHNMFKAAKPLTNTIMEAWVKGADAAQRWAANSEGLKRFFITAQAPLAALASMIGALARNLAGIVEENQNNFIILAQTFEEHLIPAMRAIIDFFSRMFPTIADTLNGMLDAIKALVTETDVWRDLLNVVLSTLRGISDWISKIMKSDMPGLAKVIMALAVPVGVLGTWRILRAMIRGAVTGIRDAGLAMLGLSVLPGGVIRGRRGPNVTPREAGMGRVLTSPLGQALGGTAIGTAIIEGFRRIPWMRVFGAAGVGALAGGAIRTWANPTNSFGIPMPSRGGILGQAAPFAVAGATGGGIAGGPVGAGIGALAGGIAGIGKALLSGDTNKRLKDFGKAVEDLGPDLNAVPRHVLREMATRAREIAREFPDAKDKLIEFSDAARAALGSVHTGAAKATGIQFAADFLFDLKGLSAKQIRPRIDAMIQELGQLPEGARRHARRAILDMAKVMEANGHLPRGTVRKLSRDITKLFRDMQTEALGSAIKLVMGIEQVFRTLPEKTAGAIKNYLGIVATALQSVGGDIGALTVAATALGKGAFNAVFGPKKKKAGGGWIGMPGAVGRDTVPILAAPGEAVLNRHQQRPVDRALRAVYGMGLEELFRREKTPHYMARGGKIPGHGAGIVGLGRSLQDMGYHVSEHPAFGGVRFKHTPGGWHYKAGALDVNADHWKGGEKPALDALAKKLSAAGWHYLWQVADHFDHLHVDMGSGTGKSLGGALLGKMAKFMVEGPASSVKQLLTRGLGLIENATEGMATGLDVGGTRESSAKGALSRKRVSGLWLKHAPDWADKFVGRMTDIAYRESRFIPNAINHNTNGSIDRGLWQINSIHGFPAGRLFDPEFNASAAVEVMRRARSTFGDPLQPWNATRALGGFIPSFAIGGRVPPPDVNLNDAPSAPGSKEKEAEAERKRRAKLIAPRSAPPIGRGKKKKSSPRKLIPRSKTVLGLLKRFGRLDGDVFKGMPDPTAIAALSGSLEEQLNTLTQGHGLTNEAQFRSALINIDSGMEVPAQAIYDPETFKLEDVINWDGGIDASSRQWIGGIHQHVAELEAELGLAESIGGTHGMHRKTLTERLHAIGAAIRERILFMNELQTIVTLWLERKAAIQQEQAMERSASGTWQQRVARNNSEIDSLQDWLRNNADSNTPLAKSYKLKARNRIDDLQDENSYLKNKKPKPGRDPKRANRLARHLRMYRRELNQLVGNESRWDAEGGIAGVITNQQTSLTTEAGNISESLRSLHGTIVPANIQLQNEYRKEIGEWLGTVLPSRAADGSRSSSDETKNALIEEQNIRLSQQLALMRSQMDVFRGFAAISSPRYLGEFASGGYIPHDGMALLHAGEWVLRKDQVQAAASTSVAAPNITLVFSGNSKDLVRLIDARVDGRAANVVSEQQGRRSRIITGAPGR